MSDLLDMGWLPDAIVRAVVEFLRSILVGAMNAMFNFGMKPLLTINPAFVTDAQFVAAHDSVFSLSIALLPILVAAGLIVMPFSEDGETSMWMMVARIVAVVVFIAVSQPLFGFMIEASNGITNALAPATFKLTFDTNLGGGFGSTLGEGVQLIMLLVAVPLMLLATIISSLLLVLRQFLVVTAALGAPFFAVLWYANWGPIKSVNKFAATWLRMGLYALLVGPIIALVMRVFDVIANGGLAASGSDTMASFYIASALSLIFPIILFVVVWKTVGWAGQPLGVDAAFTMTVAAAIAATGIGAVAVGAGVGSSAVSSASSSSSGAGSESGGSSGGSGSGTGGAGGASGGSSSGGGATATDPSAGTGNSSVGGTMRNSITDALRAHEPAVEDDIDPADGALSKRMNYAKQTAAAVPGVQSARTQAGRATNAAKSAGVKMRSSGMAGARKAVGSESIDAHRKQISQNMSAASEAEGHRNFLTDSYQAGEFDVVEAANRGVLTEAERPAEGVSSVTPSVEGEVTYETASGGEATVNINDKAQNFGQKAHSLREDASQSALSIKRIQTAQSIAQSPGRAATTAGRAGKRVGKAGVKTGKASGIVFGGAMTQSPYAAYMLGKRGGNHLIGPGLESHSQQTNSADDVNDEWAPQRKGIEQGADLQAEDAGGDSSETV